MTTKTAKAALDGDGLRLIARTCSGHMIVMDNAEGDTGARPAELLVVAQAGCAAMDVVTILRKKRQPFTRYEVRVAAEQRDDPP
ncbi:MAG: OsmC family protein, partial [Chloroflexi bacterium]|nr:OsmC family protein [Chloroflexota bacterium]